MSDHIFLSEERLFEFEDDVFEAFLSPCFKRISKWTFPMVALDGSVIRQRTGYCRNLGDIDLVIKGSPEDVMAKVESLAKFGTIHSPVPGFIRLLYRSTSVETVLGGIPFLIDFHCGGLFHEDAVVHVPNNEVFAATVWEEVGSISRNFTCPLPLPLIEDELQLKAQRYIGHDDIDILASLVSEIGLQPLMSIKTDETVRANLSHLYKNLEDSCQRFTVYFYKQLEEDQIVKISEDLLSITEQNKRKINIEKAKNNALNEINNTIYNIDNLCKEKKYSSASRLLKNINKKYEYLDIILFYQLKILSEIYSVLSTVKISKKRLKKLRKTIDTAHDKSKKIDDRLSLTFKPLRDYYNLVIIIEDENYDRVREISDENKARWLLGNCPIETVMYVSCCISLVKSLLSADKKGKDKKEILSTLEDMMGGLDELEPRFEGDELTDLISITAECFEQIKECIEAGTWFEPECVKNVNEFTKRYSHLACVSNLMSSLVQHCRKLEKRRPAVYH
jgi:hypothetical protein